MSANPASEATVALDLGSITDVGGVLVGHAQRVGDGWRSGCTVVFVPDGATPGVDVRGGGPGTRETDALDPSNLIETIHAVCLTGGSAYGLATADGVAAGLEQLGLGFPIGDGHVVAVVPAAVIFDLGRGGDVACRPDAELGRAALDAASHAAEWGAVGAGTGAHAGGIQGGVGTASATVSLPAASASAVAVTIGAVAVVNAAGGPFDPRTGLPWSSPDGLRPPTRHEHAALLAALSQRAGGHRDDAGEQRPLNTTIGVIAVSARLTKAECRKLAGVAHDGLARAIRPAHSMFDGDTVFALATGADEIGSGEPAPSAAEPGGTALRSPTSRAGALDVILGAAADVFAEACTHAVLAARSNGGPAAYRELCPSVLEPQQWPR